PTDNTRRNRNPTAFPLPISPKTGAMSASEACFVFLETVFCVPRDRFRTTASATIQSTETRRGRPACGKAYFRPVFRDREGGSCVSAHWSRLLGRFWGACLRRQKSRSRGEPAAPAARSASP